MKHVVHSAHIGAPLVPQLAAGFSANQTVYDLCQMMSALAHSAPVACEDLIEHGRFCFPKDQQRYDKVAYAAALPDDHFLAFLFSTALLMTDRLLDGDGQDNLYWHWDSFRAHYRIAPPTMRAALFCGFRLLQLQGKVNLGGPVNVEDCLSNREHHVVALLDTTGAHALSEIVRNPAYPFNPSVYWPADCATLAVPRQMGLRYLYESGRDLNLPPLAPLLPFKV